MMAGHDARDGDPPGREVAADVDEAATTTATTTAITASRGVHPAGIAADIRIRVGGVVEDGDDDHDDDHGRCDGRRRSCVPEAGADL